MEKTLVFIKPDGVERGLVGTVLNRFEQRGIKVERLELKQLTETEVDAHYQEHLERDFYPNLKRYIMSGPIVVLVVLVLVVVLVVVVK